MSSTAYSGSRRKLVIALDVGTTYSGVSYSILDPGQVPEIKGVTRFPGHHKTDGASKIPSIIYYDRMGVVRAVGAEAKREGIVEDAQDGNWIKAEWFKLHLRSEAGSDPSRLMEIPPLPLNKTVVELFADYLRYLFACTAKYIQDTHLNGVHLWNSIKEDIDFVLSHPNGWEGKEQAKMRKAAILGGLVCDSPDGRRRISFVTEGEASLHFAIQNPNVLKAMKAGEGVIVIDAGGGTVDLSAYKQTRRSIKAFEEIAASQCHYNGSVYVNLRARIFLKAFLEDSPFIEEIDYMVDSFDQTTKARFKSASDQHYVRFGTTRDNDPAHNIRYGQLKLEGSDVAEFFRPSLTCIVDAVLKQLKTAQHRINHVILVGGFSANDWLLKEVQDALTKYELNISRPEDHVNKAVSNGAISFYLDHFVRVRVSRLTFGTPLAIALDPTQIEHKRRLSTSYIDLEGCRMLPGHFAITLPKDTQVSETKEFKQHGTWLGREKSEYQSVKFTIYCYYGKKPIPQFMDTDSSNFGKLCTITVDLSHHLQSEVNAGGEKYYRANFTFILLFGFSELKAQISWEENGVEKRSPAEILYQLDL